MSVVYLVYNDVSMGTRRAAHTDARGALTQAQDDLKHGLDVSHIEDEAGNVLHDVDAIQGANLNV